VKIFDRKFEGISFSTYQSPETGAVTQRVNKSCQQLLIVNRKCTGLCHYVISVRKTSVVGRDRRELKVMKSFKYKFFSDRCLSWRDKVFTGTSLNFLRLLLQWLIACIALLRNATFVTTSSGGLAREAPWVRKIGNPPSRENLVMTSAY